MPKGLRGERRPVDGAAMVAADTAVAEDSSVPGRPRRLGGETNERFGTRPSEIES
jgi:hypothetical protein